MFCKAIKDIEPSHIQDGVKKHMKEVTQQKESEA
jgi:hypothetical protein